MTDYFAALHLKATGAAPSIRAKPNSLYGSSPTQSDLVAPVTRQEDEYAAVGARDDHAGGQGIVAASASIAGAVVRAVAPEAGSPDNKEEWRSGSNWSAEAMSEQILALEQRFDRQSDRASVTTEGPPNEIVPSSLRVSSTEDRGLETASPDQKPVDAPLRPAPFTRQTSAARNRGGAFADQPRCSVSDTKQQGKPGLVAAPGLPTSIGQPAPAAGAIVAQHDLPGSLVPSPNRSFGPLFPREGDPAKDAVPGRNGSFADDALVNVPMRLQSRTPDDGHRSGVDQPLASHQFAASIIPNRASEGVDHRSAIPAGISLAPLPPARQPSLQPGQDAFAASKDPAGRNEPTSVQVSIGRIDIREQRPSPPSATRRPPSPRLGLREYLDRRLRGGRDE